MIITYDAGDKFWFQSSVDEGLSEHEVLRVIFTHEKIKFYEGAHMRNVLTGVDLSDKARATEVLFKWKTTLHGVV